MQRRTLASASIAFGLLLVASTGAMATAQRTFVASSGNDANPCSIAQPCRGFARAITQTSTGGEVIVLDSAGYGPVVITQSVTIAAPGGVYAGISVFSGDGVTVNGANIIVTLHGLSINGEGGNNGINILNAGTVHVESCIIANMLNAGARQLAGMLDMKDTIIRNDPYGVYVQGPGQATLDHVRLEGNATGLAAEYDAQVAMQDSVVTGSSNIGVLAAYGSGASNSSSVTITRSLISFSLYGIYLDPGSVDYPFVTISDSTISDSGAWGIFSNGPSELRATRTTIVANSFGNSNGIHLLAGAWAILDGNYLRTQTDVVAEAGSTYVTRSNNTFSSSNIGGTYIPLTGQ